MIFYRETMHQLQKRGWYFFFIELNVVKRFHRRKQTTNRSVDIRCFHSFREECSLKSLSHESLICYGALSSYIAI